MGTSPETLLSSSKNQLVGNSYIPADYTASDFLPSFFQVFQIKYYDARGPMSGIDVNGIRRAWITNMAEQLFAHKSGLFTMGPDGSYSINPVPAPQIECGPYVIADVELDKWYEFVGLVIGISLLYSDPLSIKFSPSTAKLLAWERSVPDWEDFAHIDPVKFHSINQLRVFEVLKAEDIGNGMVQFHTRSTHGLTTDQVCYLGPTRSSYKASYEGEFRVNPFVGFSNTTFVIEAPFRGHPQNTSVSRFSRDELPALIEGLCEEFETPSKEFLAADPKEQSKIGLARAFSKVPGHESRNLTHENIEEYVELFTKKVLVDNVQKYANTIRLKYE